VELERGMCCRGEASKQPDGPGCLIPLWKRKTQNEQIRNPGSFLDMLPICGRYALYDDSHDEACFILILARLSDKIGSKLR
jgi:hypothetical protein